MKKRKYNMGRQAANTKLGDKRVHLVRGRGGNTKFRAIRLEGGNFSWGTQGPCRAHARPFARRARRTAPANGLVPARRRRDPCKAPAGRRARVFLRGDRRARPLLTPARGPPRSSAAAVCTRKTRILDVVYNASNNELVRTKTLVKNAIVQVDAIPFKHWYEAHFGVVISKRQGGRAGVQPASLEGKGEAAKKKLAARQAQRELDPALADALAQGRLLASISSRPGQCGRADGYILEGNELQFYLKKLNAKKSKK